MGKRVLLFLCAVLTLCSFLRAVQGADQTEKDRICKQITSIHSRSLALTEKESLSGFCGLQVSYELYLLGINSTLLTYDGNKHYDTYSVMDRTSGGHRVKAYPAQEYSMEQALLDISRNGTRDVYNIMVGFEKTNTEAGQTFGHVCMIHAILDGKVYFVEGFATSFGTQEGEPIIVSIPEFVSYWDNWTQYEGIVYFGQKDPLQAYPHADTELFIQTEQALPLVDMPLEEVPQVLRTVPPGERLKATAIYDCDGSFYYEIDDDGAVCYLSCEHTIPLTYSADSLVLEDVQLPDALECGSGFTVKGKILSPDEDPMGIQLTVKDAEGTPVLTFGDIRPGQKYELNRWTVQKGMDLSELPQGCYTYEISVLLKRARLSQGQLLEQTYTHCLARASFTVGQASRTAVAAQTPENGWSLQDGKWLCYQKGTARTGWYSENGIRYFFLADGTAATGWTELDGQHFYFSCTGAMRTGWMKTAAGRIYLLPTGENATGWQTLDEGRFYFDDLGLCKQSTWILDGELLYYLKEDGQMAVGWVDLPQGRFSFHTDGHLLARLVDGKTVPYEGEWIPEELRKAN